MTYLLDTCILSKLRRIKKYSDDRLEKWINKHEPNQYFISAITIGEIQHGIDKIEDQKQQRILADWLQGEVIPLFQERVLPVDISVCLKWGELIGKNKKAGISLSSIDTFIAATAICQNLILVTENNKDFERMNVKYYNPWE